MLTDAGSGFDVLKRICYKFVDDETSKQAAANGRMLRGVSLRGECCETGSAPDWTLPSLTSAVISHGC